METIKLTIPNMKSSHCIMVGRSAINNVSGATLKNISPATAEIDLSGATKSAIVEAIKKAGYPVNL